jgi:electron transfer flavoprotein beta subunit
MRILTCVRQVLDGEENIRLIDGLVSLNGSKLILDPMDEYGVEEALKLRDNGLTAEIIAVTLGSEPMRESLRTALSLGVDRAVYVKTDRYFDVITVAETIAQIAKGEKVDLIFCGGQQADGDSQALGPAIAAWLDWSQVTWVSELTLRGDTLTGYHDVENGTEAFSVNLPAVITTQQGLNQPRYPTLPNVLRAKQKEVKELPIELFAQASRLDLQDQRYERKTHRNRILNGKDAAAAAATLVQLLRDEAKVIA